jgi:hypothetical protein
VLRFLVVLALALLALDPHVSAAASFLPGAVDCSLGNGHCYQVVQIGGNAGAPFGWADADAFARAQTYQGNYGHLLTLETQAEYDSPLVPKVGYLGAEGPSNGPYVWTTGSDPGATVSYFGPFAAGPIEGSDASCGPFPHLCLSGSGYYGGPDVAKLLSPLPGCPCEQAFVVEYEADLVPPRVQVLAPNGGEVIIGSAGAKASFSWAAADNEGVASVDLSLSRNGPDGPYESLATDYPNTGQFDWAITAPSAADTAYFRVAARDAAGNVAEDRSDEAFTIYFTVPAASATWGRLKSIYR